MPLTDWVQNLWRNRKARRAAQAIDRRVRLRVRRLDDRRVFSIVAVNIGGGGSDATIASGQTYNLPTSTYDVSDPTGSHSATVDWGDGNTQSLNITQTGTATVDGTVAGFSHNYAAPGVYTVTVTVTDTVGVPASDFQSLQVTVNTPPVVTATGTTLNYAEGASATIIDSGITLNDANGGNMTGAVVQITGNYVSGQDVLSFTDANGITGNWDNTTGTMELSGSASVANYQTALRSVRFFNGSQSPTESVRTVSFTVDDGLNTGNTATRNISVTAVNDAPTLTAGAAIALTGTDENTASSSTLVSSLLTSAGYGDVDGTANQGIAVTGLTGNGTWQFSSNGVDWVAFDAGGTLAANNALLLDAGTGIRYQPDLQNGETATFTFIGWDKTSGTASAGTTARYGNASTSGSATAFSTVSRSASIAVSASNDPPSIGSLGGDTLAYSEGDGAVVIDQGGNATYTDVDSANLDTGTLSVAFTAGSDSAEDVLAIRNQGTAAGQIGVSGSNVTYGGVTIGTFSGGSGGTTLLITFNSASTPAAAQALVRNITYQNTDTTAPTTGTRTVRFATNDGDGAGSLVNASVTVTAVNDPPTATITPATYSATEQTALSLTGDMSIADVDAGTADVRATLTVTSGILTATAGTTGVTIGGSGTATLTLDGSLTEINNLLDGLLSSTLTYTANSDAPPASATLTLTASDLGNTGTGGTLTDSDTATINITAINDGPAIANLSGDSLAYDEGDGAVLVDQGGNATVTDADSANFATGTLTVSFAAGGVSAEDVLAIRNQGTAAGEIGVSGSNVTYGGVTIGTFTGGTSGANLVVTFNSSSSPAAAQALIRNITYENTNTTTPTAGARTVRFALTDGDGGSSGNVNTTVTVSAVNSAPVIANLSGDSLSYTEGDGTVLIDQGSNATVSDVDSTNFNTGTLTVSFTAGSDSTEDVLAIRNQGTAAGQIGVSGSNVTFGGTTIGTFTGGSGGSPLVITFNSNSATPTAVQALIRNITYRNSDTSAPTEGARTVRFVLTDGDGAGGTSTNYDMTVTVSAVNDPPTATITPTTYSATERVPLSLTGGMSIADIDAGTADVRATLTVTSGIFTATAGTTGVVIGGSGTDTLTLDGTVAEINTLLAGSLGSTLTYTANSDTPPASATLTLTASDLGNTGTGGTFTASDTATINITAVNSAPVIANLSGDALAYDEGDGTVVIEQGGDATVTDVDSANFNTGTLTVSFAAGSDSAEDVLAIRNQGTAAGQIGISGSNVRYGGTTIGTFTGGSGGSPLVITFNSNSSSAAAQALIRNITYQNTDTNAPTTGARTVRFVLSDGDGDGSGNHDVTVTVSGVDDAPTITNLSGDALSYSEGAGAVVIDQGSNATVTDIDSTNFNTGTLTVSFTAGSDSAEDVLAIRNQGTAAGQIGVSGSNVTFGGTTIGTFTGGSAGSPLVITFNAASSPAAAQALIRNITYQNTDTSTPTTGARTVRFILTDGDGGDSGNHDTTVTVSAVNDSPVNNLPAGTLTTPEDTSLVLSAANGNAISITDVDAGTDPVRTTLAVTNGTVSVTLGVGVTIVGGANGTNTLTLEGSVADINAVLAAGVTYAPTANFSGAASITVTTDDRGHNGGVSLPDTDVKTITVSEVNDPAVVGTTPNKTYTEGSPPLTLAPLLDLSDTDDVLFSGATVTITNYDPNDVLSFTPPLASLITGSYANGVLTLSGSGTRAQYEAALRSVQFSNTSTNPSAATRTIEYRIDDGDGLPVAAAGSMTVTFITVNDPPTLAPIGNVVVARNTTIGPITLTVGDVDGDPANVAVSASSTSPDFAALFPPGSITINYVDATHRTITLVPAANVSGVVDITITVDDGGTGVSTASRTFRVTVSDPPTISGLADFSVPEDSGPAPFVVTIFDPEGQPFTVNFLSSDAAKIDASSISLSSLGPGNFYLGSVPLAANANGPVTITLSVTDIHGRTTTASFVLTITPVNDAPSVDAFPSITVREDVGYGSLTVGPKLEGQDNDAEVVQDLIFSIVTAPTHGTLTLLPNGRFTYTPNANFSGTDSFQVAVTDDALAGTTSLQSAPRTIQVTVTPVADAPVFSASPSLTGTENVVSGVTFSAILSDTDGSESITSILIENVPLTVSFVDAAGSEYAHSVAGGQKTYLLTGSQFAAARIFALDNVVGSLKVTATTTESQTAAAAADQTASTITTVPLNIVNTPPQIDDLSASDIAGDAFTRLNARVSDAPNDTFRVVITWGVSTIGFDQQTIISGLGPQQAVVDEPFQFLIAPDPRNPAAPITITVQVIDKDGGVTTRSVTIQVAGTGISTTIVRDLGYIDVPVPQIVFVPSIVQQSTSAAPLVERFDDDGHVVGERTFETTRAVLLRVVSSQGVESSVSHRLSEVVLDDLTKFLSKLPDGHYRLYLSESSFTPPRMLVDVMMFRGRAVAPGDMQAQRPPIQQAAKPIAKTPPLPVETSQAAASDGPQQEDASQMDATGPELVLPAPNAAAADRDERGR